MADRLGLVGRGSGLLLGGFLCVACGESTRSDGSGDSSRGGAGGAQSAGSSGAPSAGASAGGVGAFGGVGGIVAGSSAGGTSSGEGGSSGLAPWTCVSIDALCECARQPGGSGDTCGTDWRCCFFWLRTADGVSTEMCDCQNATEEQCVDAIVSADPLYMTRRTSSCPP